MGFLRNRLLRRFSPLGRLADMALVGGALMRLARYKGWVNDDQASRIGLSKMSASDSLPLPELALVAGAAWRLLRRKKPRRA